MENINKKNILIGTLVIVILGLGSWYQWGRAPMYDFPLTAGEEIQSWDYQGAYTNNPELQAKAKAEISRLNGLFGKEGYADYELYISIANQHELMGNGKGAYDNIRKALAVDAERTGLAWHNMGKLMERLGAIKTARLAYDNMVNAQPVLQYQQVRLDFLKMRMPEEKEAIAAAEKQMNDTLGEFILE